MVLNNRERFLKTMQFEKVDRPPFIEFLAFWPETIKRWYREGLPATVDINDFFGFDGQIFKQWGIKIDFYPIPRFVTRTIEETNRYRIYTNGTGVTLKQMKTGALSMPQWLDFPIKDRKSWEQFKQRLDPIDPRRYPLDWGEELIEHLNRADYLVPLGINPATANTASFFGWLRDLIGLKNTLYLLYDNPSLIHDMNQFYEYFTIEVLKKAVKNVKFDFVYVWEDMCYKTGPLISPKMFKEFMLPHYKRLTTFLREYGIDIIMVDSDGNIEELIPLWIEGGANVVLPLEVAAGMDAVKLRKKYGKSLSLIGNIDKRALIKGKSAIKEEVMSKVPFLIKQGGYIPCIDHTVPPDVSLENYIYYLDLIKEIFGIKK